VLVVVLAILALGLAAYAAAAAWKLSEEPRPADHGQTVSDLRAELSRVTAELREADRERAQETRELQSQGATAVADELRKLREDFRTQREELQSATARGAAVDEQLAQRVAKLEGQVAGMVEMVRGLAAREPAEAPRRPEPEAPPRRPEPEAPAPPVVEAPAPDPAVSRHVKELLESPEPGARYTAAQELTKLAHPAAIPAFVQVLANDQNVMVRRSAARGLGVLKAWNAVPALVQALEERESYVAQQANFSLLAITGQDFGVTQEQSVRERKTRAGQAQKWWEKNRSSPPEGVSLEPAHF
jgi:TolA-binding protein